MVYSPVVREDDEFGHVVIDGIVAGVAEGEFGHRVPFDDTAVLVDGNNAIKCRLQDGPPLCLGLLKLTVEHSVRGLQHRDTRVQPLRIMNFRDGHSDTARGGRPAKRSFRAGPVAQPP